MIRSLSLALITLAFVTAPAVAADDADRHSGRVVDIRDGGHTLVLEEMGPWHGPNTGLTTRTFQIAAGSTMRLVRPTGRWNATSPGYEVRTIDVSALRPGDFVTVSTARDGRVASQLEVVQADDATGHASPKLESVLGK